MVERIALGTESSDFETGLDAGGATVGHGITGAPCRRVSHWFCGRPVLPLNGHTSERREPPLAHFIGRRVPNPSLRLWQIELLHAVAVETMSAGAVAGDAGPADREAGARPDSNPHSGCPETDVAGSPSR